ncbi:MAG: M20/M25/M40 family metallo-hydrolase [Pacificimonas sp.]
MFRSWWAVLIVVAAGTCFAVIGTTPPGPVPASAPENIFSAERAMVDVERIAVEPHITGSAANVRVQAYLEERLSNLGFEVRSEPFELPERSAERLVDLFGSEGMVGPPTNIIGTRGDVDAGDALLLMAHYDSAAGSPGASDDAAGVAAILEVARALPSGATAGRGLVVLFTDAEEIGLSGARQFFAEDPLRMKVGAIVNLEARGAGGRTLLFQTSQGNGEAVALYDEVVDGPAGSSLGTFVYDLLPNDTDLTPALASEIPYVAYNFAFVGRPGLYHSPMATPANLDRGSLQDMGAQALDLTRALLNGPLPEPSPSWTFFDIFGLTMVSYGTAIGWALIVVVVGLYAGAVRHGLWLTPVAFGAGATLTLLAVGGGLLYLGNLVSGADGPMNYYDRLAAIPKLMVMAVLLLVSSVFTVLAMFARRDTQLPSFAFGTALPIFLAAVGVQLAAPTTAYLLVVPLLLAGLVALLMSRPERPFLGTVGGVLALSFAAVSVGYLTVFGFQLMQSVGGFTPEPAVFAMALAALTLWPLMPAVRKMRAQAVAGALLLAGMGVALWVRLDPVADSVATYSSFG